MYERKGGIKHLKKAAIKQKKKKKEKINHK
jgi:hypothetical protein